jgi:hypothetical protein
MSIALSLALTACGGGGTDAPRSTTALPMTSSPEPSPTDDPTPTIGPTPEPATLPDGVPATFAQDVAGLDLPLDVLVPPGDEVAGVSRAKIAGGEIVVIVFATPGGDPFSQARGFVVWRHEAGGEPPWRAVYGLSHGRRDGVLAISVDTTDLTSDGATDALIREETGGSGACATYRVIDVSAEAAIWKRAVCDAEIQPNPDPIGLYEVARIYGPDDPHCCPSAIRERVLTWNGTRFAVASEEMTKL